MKTFCIVLFVAVLPLLSQALDVGPGDIMVTQGREPGYHLWIRKSEDIGSVLITESTADPEKKEPVYALRNPEYHHLNGDEKRMLNEKFLDPEKKLYSLIDSTPENHPDLGDAFHIFIPYVAVYGYSWGRSGELQILDGTYLNIRTFPLLFGDYTQGFKDNPFVMRVVQKPLEGPPEDNYMKETLRDYREIADLGGGEAVLSLGEEDILDKIKKLIAEAEGESLDLVLALDTTKSMENDIPHLRSSLVPLLEDASSGYGELRFGLVLYKDYMEQYTTRVFPFGPDLSVAQNILDTIKVFGGRDIPEAVYEALYAGIHGFPWQAQNRKIILVGDAPPHPKPRGKVTKEMVYMDAQLHEIELHTIILPQ